MTIVSLRGDDLEMDIVLSDRFTVDLSNGLDTEDFLVVGSKGDFRRVRGRLSGSAYSKLPDETTFGVSGAICVK